MQTQPSLFATAVRWAARIGSLISIGLLLAFVFGEGGDPAALAPLDWLGLALFPGGVILGMLVGFWREGWGGAMTLVSILAFYGLQFALSGRLPGGPYFLAFALPGLFFGVSWWLHNEPFDHAEPPGLPGGAV